jgi:hypothetical protein
MAMSWAATRKLSAAGVEFGACCGESNRAAVSIRWTTGLSFELNISSKVSGANAPGETCTVPLRLMQTRYSPPWYSDSRTGRRPGASRSASGRGAGGPARRRATTNIFAELLSDIRHALNVRRAETAGPSVRYVRSEALDDPVQFGVYQVTVLIQ